MYDICKNRRCDYLPQSYFVIVFATVNILYHITATSVWSPATKICINIFYLLLVTLSVWSHTAAATINPGYIPLPKDSKSLESRKYFADIQEPAEQIAPLRWCKECRYYKSPKSHHCSICQRCVLKMDHHCESLNNSDWK